MARNFTGEEINDIVKLHDACELFYEKYHLIPTLGIAKEARGLVERVKQFSNNVSIMSTHEYRLTTKLINSGYSIN